MGFVVAVKNSFDIKDTLKKYGFTFDSFYKVWLKSCSVDKYHFWDVHLSSLSKEVQTVWVKDLSEITKARYAIRELETPPARVEEAPTHALDGVVLEMKAWYAKAFKENHNTAYAFRNLKVIKALRETEKAIQVDAEFFSGIACSCGVCGRELNNDISRATGIGPICAEKIGLPRPTMDKAKEIVAQLEALSKAQGIFKGVWIPKSQIKRAG
jgi:hypothetical protein